MLPCLVFGYLHFSILDFDRCASVILIMYVFISPLNKSPNQMSGHVSYMAMDTMM
uniref:Uncharacterized protein n=1 Tax=Arundo donax TaxID=35708 RepID=A0A0A9EKL7_ARUDO